MIRIIKKYNVRGFTIVELIIVVVVISILASITVVSFSGLQKRARNSSLVTTIRSYQKALELYKADKGVYPNTNAASGRCLGQAGDLPATANFTVNKCAYNSFSYFRDNTLNNAIAPYVSQTIRLDYKDEFQDAGGYYYRGVYFESSTTYYSFEYAVPADQDCPIGVEDWGDSRLQACYLRSS